MRDFFHNRAYSKYRFYQVLFVFLWEIRYFVLWKRKYVFCRACRVYGERNYDVQHFWLIFKKWWFQSDYMEENFLHCRQQYDKKKKVSHILKPFLLLLDEVCVSFWASKKEGIIPLFLRSFLFRQMVIFWQFIQLWCAFLLFRRWIEIFLDRKPLKRVFLFFFCLWVLFVLREFEIYREIHELWVFFFFSAFLT